MKTVQTNHASTLIEHLTELRKRLVTILVINLIAALFCYQFVDVIMNYIMNLSGGMNLVYITPTELFKVYVKLAFICGCIISSPITFLQIWLFIKKGLYTREKVYILTILFLGIVFFGVGVVFCYKVVLPTTVQFFVNITVPGINAMISIASFVSFIMGMIVCFGVVFEMPVVVFFLSLIGMITPKFLLEKQPVCILAIFVMASVITPPDVISQLFLGVPMVILFEISIGISWLVQRMKKRKKYK